MKRKAAFALDRSEKLSRLLTKERLQRAGVKLDATGADPDLQELIARLRSTVKKPSVKKSTGGDIPVDLVRKLAGG